jgi:hypothetical protein
LKRKCSHIRTSKNGKRAIYIDNENKDDILSYLTRDDRHKKKFQLIAEHILEELRNPQLYDKEEINSRCKNVTAMKLFKGQENDRIYCKEVKSDSGVFIVVAAILYEKKKTTKLTKQQRTIIEKVGGYEYEIE